MQIKTSVFIKHVPNGTPLLMHELYTAQISNYINCIGSTMPIFQTEHGQF